MFTRTISIFFAVVVALFIPATATAQDWTPFPPFPGSNHLAVAPGIDGDWSAAEKCLPTSSDIGATYYAAVVWVTDYAGNPTPASNDAVPYVDALYENWRGELDAAKHVLIVLGLNNRAVAIHPGTEWVGLGFERGTITATIDNSSFKTFARSGDYASAICALAGAVDRKLSQLRGQVEQVRQNTKSLTQVLQSEFARGPALVQKAKKLDPTLGEHVESEFVMAQDKLQAATSALAERPVQAQSFANSANTSWQQAVAAVENYENYKQQIPKWNERIERQRKAIAARPDADWSGPTTALEQLDECESRISTGLKQAARGVNAPGYQVDNCLADVESRLAGAERFHYLSTVVVPSVIGGAIALVLLVLFIVAAVRRRRVERLVEAQLAAWKDALGTASERLLALESEFTLYFDAGRPAWEGASQQLDQDCADEVNRVFLMFSKAQDIYNKATEAYEAAPPLRTRPLERVLEMLESATVKIETGEKETARRIFLPLTREYEATATKLLRDLAGSYERAAALLEEASGLMEEVDRLRVELSRVGSELAEAIRERVDMGLPAEHLSASQYKGEEERARGRSVAATDPKTAITHLAAALQTLRETLERATTGNAVVHSVRDDLPVKSAGLRARIDKMREHGWIVREPGFDPDQRLNHSVRVGQRAVEMVAAEKEEAASQAWDELDADLALLDEQLTKTKDARNDVPPHIESVRERHSENEARVPDARRILEELRAEHHPEAFQRESDNLEQYREIREQILVGIGSAEKAYEEQRYLAALADLETLERALATARSFIDELHTIRKRLDEAEEEARSNAATARSHHEKMEDVRENRLGVDGALAAEVKASETRLAALESDLDEEKPNWLALADRAASVVTQSGDLLEEVTGEVAAHARAVDRLAELESASQELATRVRKEKRDRPHVEKILNDAIGAITRVGNLTDDPDIGGEELANAVANAAEWLDRARYEWKSERQLFQTAEADLAAAEARYHAVDGTDYGYGVEADCSDAWSELQQANEAADQRRWEEVVTLSAFVKNKVNSAADSAEAKADRKRRAARRAARAASSSSSYSSSSSSSSSFSSSSWSSSSSSFSGGSSYSSSSGGSSW